LEKLGISLGLVIVQILNFAIIMVVLRAWLYKPLMGMMEKRRVTIAQGLEDARIASEARANAEREAAKIITDAQLKAAEVVRDATAKAEAAAQEVRTSSDAKIAQSREAAMSELEEERNRMLGELRGQVAALAMSAAQKLIGESLTQERQEALLKEFFSGVKSGKVVVLEETKISGASAEITSALPLTMEEQDQVKSDILARVGGSATVSFRVDPSILGGLVVKVGDHVIDGSVSGQLQTMRQNLQ
jgi:F-type H+-transporting ATPase subunit b